MIQNGPVRAIARKRLTCRAPMRLAEVDVGEIAFDSYD